MGSIGRLSEKVGLETALNYNTVIIIIIIAIMLFKVPLCKMSSLRAIEEHVV